MSLLSGLGRMLPNEFRLTLSVRNALTPHLADTSLPAVSVYLGEGFRRANEASARAEARWRRVVDAEVRRVIEMHQLRDQAPPTRVTILDTVEPHLVDVLTSDAPAVPLPVVPIPVAQAHAAPAAPKVRRRADEKVAAAVATEHVARFQIKGAGTVDVRDGVVLGGPHASPPVQRLPVPSVSGRHAQVAVRDGAVFIRDVGSRHGTTVRGARVGEKTAVRIEVGDTVTLADAELRFVGLFTDGARREEV